MQLEQLREAIDAIDRSLIEKLLERLGIVHKVGELKAQAGCKGSMIRPAREASMMRRLFGSAEGQYPAGVIFAIWRAIIAGSTQKEAPFSLSLPADEAHKPAYWLAREYFGSATPCRFHVNLQALLLEVASAEHVVGILPLEVPAKGRPWWVEWLDLPNKPHVFAKFPCLNPPPFPVPEFVCLAHTPAEPSGNDRTLLLVTDAKSISRESIFLQLKNQGIHGRDLLKFEQGTGAGTTRYQLLDLEGFHLATDSGLQAASEKLQALQTVETPVRLDILGHYALLQ